MAKPKIKPGTPHPNRKGMVMGKNGRYVAKSTYAKQVKAASSSSKPTPKAKPPAAKPAPKALPPKATTGGRRYSNGTASSRRAQAAAKQVRAAQGTKGTTVRQGQPAGAANRRYGADRVARSVRRAQVETAVRGAASKLSKAGPAVAGTIGMELASKLAQTAGKPGQPRMSRLGIQGPAKPVNKPKNKVKQPESKVKVQKDNTTVTRKKSRDYQAEKKAREAKAAKTSQPKKQQQAQTPKPKVKKGGGVTGVGPVKSGRTYSTKVSGKSVTQQNVESLKKMGTKSERFKKLAAEAKKKSLEQGKKNRERKVRRGGRR